MSVVTPTASEEGLLDAREVANELIRLGRGENMPLDILQLLKIEFFVHAWSLVLMERPLIKQPVMAWVYGPVFPEVYEALKGRGSAPINDVIIDPATGAEFDIEPLDKERVQALGLIRFVWDLYKNLSGGQLVSLTHKAGTPWHQIWDPVKTQRREIPNSTIADWMRDQYGSMIPQVTL